LKPTLKNSTAGKPVSYAQTGLKLQSRRKKLILTKKPALVIRMSIVCANGHFNMWVVAETDTPFTIFDLSALEKQFLTFLSQNEYLITN
jgi:hypothetical protein